MSGYLEHDGYYDDDGNWIEEAPDTGREIPLPEEPDWFQDGPPVNREHDGYYDDNGDWIEESPRVENYIKNSETIEIGLDRFSGLSARIRANGETRNAACGTGDDCLPSLPLPAPKEGSAKQKNKSLPLPSTPPDGVENQSPGKKTQSPGRRVEESDPSVPSDLAPPPMKNYAQNFAAEYATDPLGMMGAYGAVLARAGYKVEAQRDDFIEGKDWDFFCYAIQTVVRQKQRLGQASLKKIVWGMNCQIPLMLHSAIFMEGFADTWLKHYGQLIEDGKVFASSKYPWPKYISMLLEKLSRVFMDPHPQGGWMLAREGTSQMFWYPNHYKLRHYFKDRAARGWKFPWDFEKIESKKDYRREWGDLISWDEYTLFKNQPREWQTVWNVIRDIRRARDRKRP